MNHEQAFNAARDALKKVIEDFYCKQGDGLTLKDVEMILLLTADTCEYYANMARRNTK